MFMHKGEGGEEEEPEEDQEEQKNIFDRGMQTLRTVCGQTFEKLSRIFEDEIFEKLKEKIMLCLTSTDWKLK